MKKIFLILTVIPLIVASCDFLDVVPEDTATTSDMYSSQMQAERTLNRVYGYLPYQIGFHYYPDSFLGGEIVSFYENAVRHATWKGMLHGEESANSTYFGAWSTATATKSNAQKYNLYKGIRDAWNFINNVGSVPGLDAATAIRYTGEAYYLIGVLHWILMEHYGPVVIVDHEVSINAPASEFIVQRSSWDECAAFVCRMFDEAAYRLPATRQDKEVGRATSVAAKAYKACVLVYTASPLVNGNTDFADFLNYDGTPLISQTYDPGKWQDALDALGDAITFAETNGYHLWTDPASAALPDKDRGRNNYYKLFIQPTTNEGNKCEYLVSSCFHDGSDTPYGYFNYYLQRYGVPRTWNGATGTDVDSFRPQNTPTMQAVCTFLTEDGLPLWADPKTKAGFAANHLLDIAPGDSTARLHRGRDPRFYASIAFDRGNIIYNGSDKNYIHTRAGEFHGYCGSRTLYHSATGYYFQKYVSESTQFDETNKNFKPVNYRMPVLRLAELYLNYAEAYFELNGSLDATSIMYIDKVRTRAGLPSFSDSWALAGGIPTGDNLRQALRAEISAEVCLEGRAYDNYRRWKVAHEYLGSTPMELNTRSSDSSFKLSDGPQSAADFYRLVPLKEIAPRTFTYPRNYWYAIPITEIKINHKLVQNPGY